MKSLQELCAITILRSAVHPDSDDESVQSDDCQLWAYGPKSRCACDYYHYELNPKNLVNCFKTTVYKTDHTTKEFISRLPLPESVKEFMNEVAKETCQDHPQQNWVPGHSVGESDHGSGNDINWPIIDLV